MSDRGAERLGVVCALESEEKLLRGVDPDRVLVRRAGLGPERARAAAQGLATLGVSTLISFGFAGGLDPKLRSGDLLAPIRIDDESQRSIASSDSEAATGVHLCTATVVSSVVEKARYYAQGYASVDMESFAIAAVAEARGLEFRLCRVVCDDALTVLPHTAVAAVREDGGLSPRGLVGSLVRRPGDLPRLLRLARASKRAEKTLRDLAAGW